MTPTGKRHISPVDTIWLNMDRPNNLMVIISLMFLESVPAWDDLAEVIRGGIVERFPVFSQRPTPPLVPVGLPSWEDDPDFSLEHHLHHVTLAAPGDDATLQRYVDERIPVPLDRAHALWEIHLIDGYGSGAVLFCRFHHALADGIALTRVLLSMTEDGRGARSPDADRGDEVTGTHDHSLVRDMISTTMALARGGLEQVSHLAHPSAVVDALGLGVRTSEVVADLLLAHNPDNVFNGTPGVRKRVVWTRAFPLADLKRVSRLAQATLNDLLLSAVAGALHTYQRDHGAEPVDLVTMVPVNVRPLDQPLPRELGNQFAILFFKFPSETPTAVGRLAETKRRMDWLKASPEAVLTFGLIAAIGRTTRDLERYIVDFFANKAIGVTTNVAGPTSIRTFAGVPMTSVLGWVPGSGKQTVGVCIFTYAGT
ncbi:MAG TPA: wax ester/triacylglycerol synthase domain-containing protein, partial [Candidatus Lustribacter sp.]|nr:wax ester/triacylglycerol synthase domain-containing protein [Candidatus Lustribacter sp.]